MGSGVAMVSRVVGSGASGVVSGGDVGRIEVGSGSGVGAGGVGVFDGADVGVAEVEGAAVLLPFCVVLAMLVGAAVLRLPPPFPSGRVGSRFGAED